MIHRRTHARVRETLLLTFPELFIEKFFHEQGKMKIVAEVYKCTLSKRFSSLTQLMDKFRSHFQSPNLSYEVN